MSFDDEVELYESLMERMASAYRTRMVAICRMADLTPPQFWALFTIRTLGQSKMSPLADQLGLSMGAVSTLVDRLVGRGLVERRADEHDRRAVYVSLTAKGEQVLDAAKSSRRDVVTTAFEQLTPETRQQLLSGLQAIIRVWEKLPNGGAKPFEGCFEE